MYSDKDTCCFCIPISVGVVIIGCTVILELLAGLAEKNAYSICVTIGLFVLFIITAIYRNVVCARRFLAYGYVIAFCAEIVINTLLIIGFFKTNYPH